MVIKRHKANIAVTLIIFFFALIMFAICAIDVGYVVTTRFKTQKITETAALYMTSYLNSLPEEERIPSSLDFIKEKFENLYSNQGISGYWDFKFSDIKIKNEPNRTKIQITTETTTPTLFLRYTGIGAAKIMQSAYASSAETAMVLDADKTENLYYTFKTADIITDKPGDDIKVDYNGGYFIFAGLEDSDNKIHWAEIGSMTDSDKTEYNIYNSSSSSRFKAYCIKPSTTPDKFDFSSDPEKTAGLVKYIRIYKADCTIESIPPGEDDPEREETETASKSCSATGGFWNSSTSTCLAGTDYGEPEVTILRSVRLIRKSQF